MSDKIMRLLRGLGGRVLTCGCLVGIYETYGGEVVAEIDARGPACQEAGHTLHAAVPDAVANSSRRSTLPADRALSRS